MNTVDKQPDIIAELAELAPVHRELILLKRADPEVYCTLMTERKRDQRHQRFMKKAPVLVRVFGNACGLVALSLLAAVAWHAFNLKDANQGAAIICTGAVSIVAVFVTGQAMRGSSRNNPRGSADSSPPDPRRRRDQQPVRRSER
jgi:hypothetical protein